MKQKSDRLKELLVFLGALLTLYMFYKSIWVFILLLPCMAVYRKMHRKEIRRRNRDILNAQFRDFLESLAASLRAGYSVENALKECAGEMAVMHGEDSPICRELTVMINQTGIGIPAEVIFREFAQRCKTDDIRTFASVFGIVSRTGGDLVDIIQKTAADIAGKIDTSNEIRVVIRAKELEFHVMILMPVCILAYINLTGDGMLDPLYGNLKGVILMTLCLGVYTAAILLGKRMIRIEV